MFLHKLSEILPSEQIFIGDNIDAKYLSDFFGREKGAAIALVFPKTTEQVSTVVRLADAYRVPVIPRGAGTNLAGSTFPEAVHNAIIIDLSLMNQILALNPETFTVTVQPGVLLCDLQEYVESHGLFYPPDPGEKHASIGGNISTNAGGMRAVKYGVTRDYVRELEVVLPNGEIVCLGAATVKDASGLSLKNLIIGAEGTLGIVTKATLRLIAKPEFSVDVLVSFSSLRTALESVPEILKTGVIPTAIEFIAGSVVQMGERFTSLQFPAPKATAYLLLTFDGPKPQIADDLRRVENHLRELKALDFLTLDKSGSVTVWKIRGCLVKAVEAQCAQEPLDLVVPIDKTADLIESVQQLTAETGVVTVAFGHAGDGNVHLCVLREQRNDEEWQADLTNFLTHLYRKAADLGGLVSAEHGIGIAKKRYYLALTDPAIVTLQRQIKAAIDPKGIFNPGKSYSI
ncbi:FAD-binding oxidoreductase [Arcanobacterium hippocoleae]|uniref:Glycolate oxidase n=1 Tax=Arcanobacterium hippocoleae TaxID=149017 RepID=A0ABU1T031_9ACTO|nr:FAD-linked oxidase C-terminal domain-containing protein [Arcanobacterium hippocoleae]MDR6938714.1 glycolate oxidase [Arcanobacterium hippocoleae]